jgi:hypothetical protein
VKRKKLIAELKRPKLRSRDKRLNASKKRPKLLNLNAGLMRKLKIKGKQNKKLNE